MTRTAVGPAPRWFALLPLLAIAMWWPLSPYWQSDDFLAVHYASEIGNVAHDFVGPQYGATDIWLFYRPLITLSFWVDQLFGGGDPFVSHCSNVFAHGISALLVALIWRRFLGPTRAFGAGLLWAFVPGHVGSIAWGVGRVDSHTVVWCLLAGLLILRQCERRLFAPDRGTARWPAVIAFVLALMSKELAFVVPPAASLLAFYRAGSAIDSLGGRVRFALRESLPVWLTLLVYFGWRWFALGQFGGYLGAAYDPLAMAQGYLTYVANVLTPLRWIGNDALGDGTIASALPVLGWVALLPAVWLAVRRPGRTVAGLVMFGCLTAPLAAFLAGADNVHNQRYFYLPAVALAGLLAAPGRWVGTAVVLVAWALPFVAVRQQQLDADRESAAIHAAIHAANDAGAASPMFVAGLPRANASGTAVQLHFGIDRILQRPFTNKLNKVFALRPLDPRPSFRPFPDSGPRALPGGSTWRFEPERGLIEVAPTASEQQLPDLPIRGDEDGVIDMSTERLLAATARYPGIFERNEPSFGLETPGVAPTAYRLTLFTANGYICCICQNYGLGPPGTGRIDMLRFFANGQPLTDSRAALTGPAFDRLAGLDLLVPTTIDLRPEFPALLEAGRFDLASARFTATHRARRLVTFRFDRSFPSWIRLLQGP
ncbi:MAG: hypothetical protein NXI31_01370 [bacterium]|nr:hypothetical protein [bacterium]